LLQRAIDSVKGQTYQPIELIVVDDWSSDGTKEFCEQQDFKYIHIPQSESKGGNYARNLGIKNAQGEYIAFLDDDDSWLPEKIEKQVRLLLDKQCGLVFLWQDDRACTARRYCRI
jgi:glycosyltransferase involved in cell wall biosynthesis